MGQAESDSTGQWKTYLNDNEEDTGRVMGGCGRSTLVSPAITWRTSHPPRDRQFDPGFGHPAPVLDMVPGSSGPVLDSSWICA